MDCKDSEVGNVANRIKKMINESEVEWWGDRFSVTAAFGGAGSRPEDTPELLVGRAEQALRESIAAGANGVSAVTSP